MKIARSITQLVGGNPLADLNNIPQREGSLAKIVVKLESSNPIAIASYVMTKTKPKRELQRFALQLSFGFYVLTYLAMAILLP